MRRLPAVAIGFLLLGATTACGAASRDGSEGDCSARIDYRGVVYRSHNLLRPSAPTEPAQLGSGDVVGCEREAVDQVAVHEIRGVAPGVAIAVVDQDWRGLYVPEGTSPGDWPSSIRAESP